MKKEIIKELNVEKINICEPDGTVKLSLFNSKNIPSLIVDYEDIFPGHRADDGVSGLMFYNNHGDECGGLIYGSQIDDHGNVQAGLSLTFDKWKQDQLVQMQLQKSGDKEMYGFSIYDRPNCHIKESLDLIKEFRQEKDIEKQKELIKRINESNHKRIFVGHDADGETKIALFDKQGKEQIKLFVDDDNTPTLKVDGKKYNLRKILETIKKG